MKITIPMLPILIIFVTLKLTGAITWPWPWVLAPLWCPVAVVIAVLVLVYFWCAVNAIYKR